MQAPLQSERPPWQTTAVPLPAAQTRLQSASSSREPGEADSSSSWRPALPKPPCSPPGAPHLATPARHHYAVPVKLGISINSCWWSPPQCTASIPSISPFALADLSVCPHPSLWCARRLPTRPLPQPRWEMMDVLRRQQSRSYSAAPGTPALVQQLVGAAARGSSRASRRVPACAPHPATAFPAARRSTLCEGCVRQSRLC